MLLLRTYVCGRTSLRGHEQSNFILLYHHQIILLIQQIKKIMYVSYVTLTGNRTILVIKTTPDFCHKYAISEFLGQNLFFQNCDFAVAPLFYCPGITKNCGSQNFLE